MLKFLLVLLIHIPSVILQNHSSFLLNRNEMESENRNRELAVLSTVGILKAYGYSVEVHEVTTNDGYILTIHRILCTKCTNFSKKRPVLFNHGVAMDSVSWLINDRDKILALQLADLDFDVWLGNFRGTTYSRKHKSFTDRDENFFRYSMDEIGKYDVPAFIDYVLYVTGEQKLIVLGHSMGCAVFHIAMSNYPSYNHKVSLMVDAAPGVYSDPTNPLHLVVPHFYPFVKIGVELICSQTGEFPAPFFRKLVNSIVAVFCSIPGLSAICDFFDQIFVGAGDIQPHVLSRALQVLPSPVSKYILLGYIQSVGTKRFQYYDYGNSMNKQRYGSAKPPLYYLNATTAPVAVFYGETDSGVGPKAARRLASELPNVVYFHGAKRPFNHIDYIFGKYANEKFNKFVVELMLRY